MTRVDVNKLMELLVTHPNENFVFDFSVIPTRTTLDRDALEKLIQQAEVQE